MTTTTLQPENTQPNSNPAVNKTLVVVITGRLQDRIAPIKEQLKTTLGMADQLLYDLWLFSEDVLCPSPVHLIGQINARIATYKTPHIILVVDESRPRDVIVDPKKDKGQQMLTFGRSHTIRWIKQIMDGVVDAETLAYLLVDNAEELTEVTSMPQYRLTA